MKIPGGGVNPFPPCSPGITSEAGNSCHGNAGFRPKTGLFGGREGWLTRPGGCGIIHFSYPFSNQGAIMKTKIGIRREDINKWEKRVPLIPSHIRELADRHPVEFVVQPSTIRIFTDDDYRVFGIPVQESLSPCAIVLALKEIPL